MQAFYRPQPNAANRPELDSNQAVEALESMSDEQLIELYRRGDRRACEALIQRHDRSIYNLAYRLSRNHEDAQEIVGETHLRICLNLHLVQHAVTIPAWINRIVANIYINMRRHLKRNPTVSLDALEEKAGDAVCYTAGAVGGSPERYAEAAERKALLKRAISMLPASQRPVVALFHQEGRSYEEIADSLNIPTGTVKSRLNRARVNLRKRLTPHIAAFVN